MTDNSRRSSSRRSIALEVQPVEKLQESLDRLRREVGELRASRKRLVLAADADRRRIERELHEGVQQHLLALAVKLQLAGQLADADPAAKALLDEMGRDVQQALDETMQLAQRIYPPLLDAGGLVASLRAAAASAGNRAVLEVAASASYPPEVAATVYACFLEALEHTGVGAPATVTVQEDEGGVSFEVVVDGSPSEATAAYSNRGFDRLRDRVEALGGRLTIRSEPGGGTRLSGSFPPAR